MGPSGTLLRKSERGAGTSKGDQEGIARELGELAGEAFWKLNKKAFQEEEGTYCATAAERLSTRKTKADHWV